MNLGADTSDSFVTLLGGSHVHAAQRHAGLDKAFLQHRKAVYEAARAANPQRLSGATRDWESASEVWLNSPKELCADKHSLAKFA